MALRCDCMWNCMQPEWLEKLTGAVWCCRDALALLPALVPAGPVAILGLVSVRLMPWGHNQQRLMCYLLIGSRTTQL
jgi:hypothetical protein